MRIKGNLQLHIFLRHSVFVNVDDGSIYYKPLRKFRMYPEIFCLNDSELDIKMKFTFKFYEDECAKYTQVRAAI